MPTRPIMLAVGGDSGTGKSTLTRGLERIFGAARIATVDLDDYHSLDRAQRAAVGLSALDPRASNFAAMEEDLWALREGRAIEKPVYNHANGTFGAPTRAEPKEILIVNGLFPLFTRALRSLFDITVWVEPEPELRPAWKIQRDTRERGYVESEVRAELARRTPDVEKFLVPQSKYADLTVTFYRPEDWNDHHDPTRLSGRIRKGGRFRPLDYTEFASRSTSIRQQQASEGTFPETIIEIDGHIEPSVALSVEDSVWSHVDKNGDARPAGIGEFRDSAGDLQTGHALALAQLLIARRVVLIEEALADMGQ